MQNYKTNDMKEETVEALASKVHDSWWEEKKKQGFHSPADCKSEHRKCYDSSPEHGKNRFDEVLNYKTYKWCDKCHPDMYPYEELSDNVKEYDRVTVRTVLKAQAELIKPDVTLPIVEDKGKNIIIADLEKQVNELYALKYKILDAAEIDGLLRSLYSICSRQGKEVNWEAITNRVKEVLDLKSKLSQSKPIEVVNDKVIEGVLEKRNRKHLPTAYIPDLDDHEWFVRWHEPERGLRNLSLPLHPENDYFNGCNYTVGQKVKFTQSYYCDRFESWDCAKPIEAPIQNKTKINNMKLYQKKMLTYAEPITKENLDNLKLLGAAVVPFESRSHEAFLEHSKVGDVVIWMYMDEIKMAQARTIEGIHTADLPSRLMVSQSGGKPYFCTEEVFQETYKDSGYAEPVNQDDFSDYIHQGSN